MSAAVDIEQIRLACMADLGRARQDQLPLSDREMNGSSFKPARDGFASKFDSRFKSALKNQWSVVIQDEESEQIEGLANDDARPWARKAAHDTDYGAPPRAAKPVRTAPKKPKPSDENMTFGRLGGHVPEGATPVFKDSSRPAEQKLVHRTVEKNSTATMQTAQIPATKTAAPKPATTTPPAAKMATAKTVVTVPPASKTAATIPPAARTATPTQPAAKTAGANMPVAQSSQSASKPEYILYSGTCKMTSAPGTPDLTIYFALVIDSNTDCAFFTLTLPSGERKVHNVLDLEPPVVENHCCVVAASRDKGKFRYNLQLDDEKLTRELKRYLESLRYAAIKQRPAATTSGSAAANGPQLTVHKAEAKDSKTSTPLLIDMGDASPVASDVATEKQVSTSTMIGSEDRVLGLIQHILPELTGCGLQLSEDNVQEMEAQATEFWLRKGYLETKSDDMKMELLELLRQLARLDRSARLRRSNKAAAAAEVQRLTGVCQDVVKGWQLPTARIQYTPAEIASLGGRTMSHPEPVAKPGLPLTQATSPVEKAQLPSISKYRGWLTGQSDDAENPGKADLLVMESVSVSASVTSRVGDSTPGYALHAEPMDIDADWMAGPRPRSAATVRSPATPILGNESLRASGLDSSRWA